MSVDYSQQQPIMAWNTQMKWWETSQVDLLSGLSEPFLGTWQTSGTMRNGQVFELPMQEHRTTVSESSLLRSPKASEGQGGALGEAEALRRGNTVGVRDQVMDLVASQGQRVSRVEANVLPTPTAIQSRNATSGRQPGSKHHHGITLHDLVYDGSITSPVLPTPMARDWKGDKAAHERNGVVQTDSVERAIFHSGEILLGTPRTSSANGSTQSQVALDAPKARIEDQVHSASWGKFEPAIRRWEEVLGRPAPAPTKPDGKEGAHRLSSAFTEWMMGVPEGWITDVGLSRADELKACGNGVVPQQAELALRMLLEGVSIDPQGSVPMLPTATPSDAYIGNLSSKQRKPGSMHSVNLAVAAEGLSKGEFQ